MIYFDVTTEFTLCFNPDTENFVPCSSNYFEIYIHRGKDRPEINAETAETDLLSQFSSFYNITANNSSLSKTPRKQTQIITSDLKKADGVTFAVRSRGACGKILNMTIYYYYCEETFVNGARLKKTSSPKIGSKRVLANCPKNSQPSSNFTRLEGYCYRDGSWSMNEDSKCLCFGEHEPNKEHGCLRKYKAPFVPRYSLYQSS